MGPAVTGTHVAVLFRDILCDSWSNAFVMSSLPPAGSGSLSSLLLLVFPPGVGFGQKHCPVSRTVWTVPLTLPASFHV